MRHLIPWRGRALPQTQAFFPLTRLDREMDRMLQNFFGDQVGFGTNILGSFEGWAARIDVSETEEEVVVSAEIPGVEPKDLDISVTGDVLTLSGEKRAEETKEEGKTSYTERIFGAFRRDVPLPSEVDAEKAEAEHKNGIVRIRLPKAVRVRPRRIEVKGAK